MSDDLLKGKIIKGRKVKLSNFKKAYPILKSLNVDDYRNKECKFEVKNGSVIRIFVDEKEIIPEIKKTKKTGEIFIGTIFSFNKEKDSKNFVAKIKHENLTLEFSRSDLEDRKEEKLLGKKYNSRVHNN